MLFIKDLSHKVLSGRIKDTDTAFYLQMVL